VPTNHVMQIFGVCSRCQEQEAKRGGQAPAPPHA
jgi:hypothetical protein